MANRPKYREGMAAIIGNRLPYCKNCIDSYIAGRTVARMNADQRKAFLKKTRHELEERNDITEEDIEEARKRLHSMNITEEEIKYIFQNIKTK